MKYIYNEKKLKFHYFFMVALVLHLLSLIGGLLNYFFDYDYYDAMYSGIVSKRFQISFEAMHAMDFIAIALGLFFVIRTFCGASKRQSYSWRCIMGYSITNIVYALLYLLFYWDLDVLSSYYTGTYTGQIILFSLIIFYYVRRKPLFYPDMMKEIYPDPKTGLVICRYCKRSIPCDSIYCEWCGKKIKYVIHPVQNETDNIIPQGKKQNKKVKVFVIIGIIIVLGALVACLAYYFRQNLLNTVSTEVSNSQKFDKGKIDEGQGNNIWEELKTSIISNGSKTSSGYCVTIPLDDFTFNIKYDEQSNTVICDDIMRGFDDNNNYYSIEFNIFLKENSSSYSYRFRSLFKQYNDQEFYVIMDGTISPEKYNENKIIPVVSYNVSNGYSLNEAEKQSYMKMCQKGLSDTLLILDNYLNTINNEYGIEYFGFSNK